MILVVAAAVYAWQVMPPRTELVQDLPGNTATPSLVLALLAVLTIAATLQVPAVLASWTESLTLLRTLIGSDSDLLGLNMIPGAVILASPALASLTLLAFVATSILAVGAPPPLVSRALGACVLIQGATAGGHYAIERTVREIAATLQSVMSTPPDPVASAQISDWLARYDRAGGTVGSRLTWLLAGYVLAVVLARVMAPVERVQPPSDPVAHLEQPAPRPVVRGAACDDTGGICRLRIRRLLGASAPGLARVPRVEPFRVSDSRRFHRWHAHGSRSRGGLRRCGGSRTAPTCCRFALEATGCSGSARTRCPMRGAGHRSARSCRTDRVGNPRRVRRDPGARGRNRERLRQRPLRRSGGRRGHLPVTSGDFSASRSLSAELQIEFLPGAERRVSKAMADRPRANPRRCARAGRAAGVPG